MTFTASDVASLSRALSRWEYAEYVFAGLVAVACAGEYVADFTNWFTGGIKEAKDRLAKRSTLLLIVALAFELICLVRTNSLSGQLIGSLDDKAESAEGHAQAAFDKSSTAESKAGNAQASADKALGAALLANDVAGKAQDRAGNASELADKTAKDAALIESLVSARNIADPPGLTDRLRQFSGFSVIVESPAGDPEASSLCSGLWSVMKSAGMNVQGMCGSILAGGQIVNIWVAGPDDKVALSVAEAISQFGKLNAFVNGPFGKQSQLMVYVGQKAPFRLFPQATSTVHKNKKASKQ